MVLQPPAQRPSLDDDLRVTQSAVCVQPFVPVRDKEAARQPNYRNWGKCAAAEHCLAVLADSFGCVRHTEYIDQFVNRQNDRRKACQLSVEAAPKQYFAGLAFVIRLRFNSHTPITRRQAPERPRLSRVISQRVGAPARAVRSRGIRGKPTIVCAAFERGAP